MGILLFNRSTVRGWQPTDIPGMVGYYDLSDTASIENSSGFASQIGDKSGLGNHAVQASSPLRAALGGAVNGLHCLSFTNNSMRYNLPSSLLTLPSGPWTYLMVYKDSVGAAVRRLLVGELSGTFNHGLYTNTSPAGFNARQSASAAGTGFTLDTNTHCFIGRRSGTSLLTALDGSTRQVTISSAANTTIDSLYLGGSGSSLLGSLCEVHMFNASVSNSDINKDGGMLAAKWNFPWADF